MINRYSIKEIADIWNDKRKFEIWLEIEKQVINFLNENKKIDDATTKYLMDNMLFDLDKIYELEKETKHDVIAFLRVISSNIDNENAKKWIHYGLTSTDIVDTANAIMVKESNDIILKSLKELYESLKEKAYEYKDLIQIGRTHGIHAEPVSFGLKFAIWCDELNRNFKRFELARNDIEVGKISGATGTFANTGLELQDYVCNKLNIGSSNTSTQVLQRDNHAFYFAVIETMTTTIEKISFELRHLSRTEVNEVSENFSEGQKGSSAMPHKKNPVELEKISGLCRMIKGYCQVPFENNALWHERDISHSSNERIIFLDCLTLVVYVIRTLNKIIKKLIVNKKAIQDNLKKTNGLIFSQSVLLFVLENKKLSREFVYDNIQKIALDCYENNKNFLEEIKNSELLNHIDQKELENIFDYKRHIKYVDDIYRKVFK